jgi:hypothetical protein
VRAGGTCRFIASSSPLREVAWCIFFYRLNICFREDIGVHAFSLLIGYVEFALNYFMVMNCVPGNKIGIKFQTLLYTQ